MEKFNGFHVTGVTTDGRRFRQNYSKEGAWVAFGVNLWRGSVWGVLPDGKRKLLKRVYN